MKIPLTILCFTLLFFAFLPTGFGSFGWVQLPNRPVKSQYIDCVTYNDLLYTINGRLSGDDTPAFQRQCNLYVFNPDGSTWNKLANPLWNGDAGTSGVINGVIYYTHFYTQNGSYAGRNNLAYYISNDTWIQKQENDQTSYAHWDSNGGVINSKLYVIGGTSNGASSAKDDVYEYNPSTNSWSTKQSAPSVMYKYGAGIYEDKIYCFYDKVYVYTPSTDSWQTKSSVPSGYAKGYTVVSKQAYNDKFLVMFTYGGISEPSDCYEYDIEADSFTLLGAFPERMSTNHCSGNVINNVMYQVGGTDQPANTANNYLHSIDLTEAFGNGVLDGDGISLLSEVMPTIVTLMVMVTTIEMLEKMSEKM